MERTFLHIRSESFGPIDDPYRRVDAQIDFSEADWKALTEDSASLGMKPDEMLRERLKRAARPKALISRITHAKDRVKLYDGYDDFWLPFVRRLIIAHIAVLASGVALDVILGWGRTYEAFYWAMVLSLVIGLIAWGSFRIAHVMRGAGSLYDENQHELRFQLFLAENSERLMWTSVVIFSVSVIVRLILGIVTMLGTGERL